MHDNTIGVLILAGGSATRLPRKLELDARGVPLIVRVYRNCSGRWPVTLSGAALNAGTRAQIAAPFIADRSPGQGPLGGIVSSFEQLAHERVFIVAGDLPNVTVRELGRLLAAWQAGDRAVVASGEAGIEPLVALYDRAAFLQAAAPIEARGGGVREVAAKLNARRVPFASTTLTNVNTPADYEHALQSPIT
jgi:molybdopterin-guanine dinucleotide biosynthesis protein A